MRLKSSKLKKTTSIAEPLDSVLERHRRSQGLDCFIIVWDLVPPWDPDARPCRWQETLLLFEGLAGSECLERRFRDFAEQRLAELRARPNPGNRRAAPVLTAGAIVAACIEPVFESIFMNEQAMRKSLNVAGSKVRDWPSSSLWDPLAPRAADTVAQAVDAARATKSARKLFKRLRSDYTTGKTTWGIHFLKSGFFDSFIGKHPFGRRLSEIS
ncbi:MAG: hypothetical protein U0Q16_09510 [Bryobacteraceae bacterium]